MSPVVAALVGLAGVPLGWFASVLVERVPDYDRYVFRSPFRTEGSSPARIVGTIGLVAALFALVALRFERPADLVPYLAYALVVTVLALIDIDTLRLPDRLLLPYLAVSVPLVVAVSALLREPERITSAFVGAAVYFGFLFLVHLLFGPRALGFGDVKLAALMGLYVGWAADGTTATLSLVLWGMFIGFMIGAVTGIVLFISRQRSKHYPFGPFLVAGSLAAILLSQGLVAS